LLKGKEPRKLALPLSLSSTPEIRQSLWKKCRSAVSFTDVIWINILAHDPLLEFLKESVLLVADSQSGPFQLPSHILAMKSGRINYIRKRKRMPTPT
jgi:hypothetical protein